MSQDTLKTPDNIDVVVTLTPLHFEQFEQARIYIEMIYGKAPPTENLIHLCLCKPSWEIVNAFTKAVQEIAESGALSEPEESINDPILSL